MWRWWPDSGASCVNAGLPEAADALDAGAERQEAPRIALGSQPELLERRGAGGCGRGSAGKGEAMQTLVLDPAGVTCLRGPKRDV